MSKRSTTLTVLRLTTFAAVMLVLLAAVIQAIQRPVGGDTRSYSAMFTDANGLRTGDDVRAFGVQIGKVTTIELAGDQARVGFTAQTTQPIYDTSTPAIRYQSLAGQRYLDIQQPALPGTPLPGGATIGADHTIASFDITQLFNGLQPVLTELSPGAVNTFAENALAVIQGDGSGVGPALEALDRLSRYVTDRQAVISAILANLGRISEQIKGRSPHLVALLEGFADVFTTMEEQVDGLLQMADVSPYTIGPLNRLMATLGLTQSTNPDLRRLFPDPDAAVELLGRLPGLLQAMANTLPVPGASGGTEMTCSKGEAAPPSAFQILIAGQRIAICNP